MYNPEKRGDLAIIVGLLKIVTYPFRLLFRYLMDRYGKKK